MKRQVLHIGRWEVEIYFAPDGYDAVVLLDRLYEFGANAETMRRALDIMESGAPNTGFTFPNPYEHIAVMAIGPTTGSEEFIDTLIHEVHHLAVAIAAELGIDLDGEGPAYLSGDTARSLARTICELGCPHCS